MLGLTIYRQVGGGARLVGLAIATLFALSVFGPSSARAAGCTDTWEGTSGGSWFEAAKWSKKAVPTSSDEACITASGTYEVKLTQTGANVTVKALTIGGTTGTQTLAVGSSSSANAVLTTSSGIANGVHGAIVLTNGDAAANNVTVVGPLTNAGTLTSEPAVGGLRTLQGSLTNTGTIAVNQSTTFNAEALLSNQGAVNVAEGKQLLITGAASFTNGTGGKILGAGNGEVFENSGTFTEAAGTTSGTRPVIVDDATLAYTGAGSGPISLRGASTLTGASSAGQSLAIESTGSENATPTAPNGFTNGGSIALTNGDAAANNATLSITSGSLTNTGTLSSETANGGARTILGNVTNGGTIAVNAGTAFSQGSSLLNNLGAVNVAEGKQLTVSNSASFTNGSAGKIVGTGSGDVFESGGTFTEGAGTTSGTKPVYVDDATLAYTGTGASAIALRGNSSLTGNLAAGQSLSIESTSGENATTTAAMSFANAGAIKLTNGDLSANNAALVVSAGTLSNSGSVTAETPVGGARTLQGNITNTGTIAIDASTAYNAKALLQNEGTLSIAEGKQLTDTGGASLTNGSGGKIIATGSGDVFQAGGTFTEGAGTITGAKPVYVDDAALIYTGSGSGLIAVRGACTLAGNLAAGQLLSIESTSGENATTTAAASFTNAGSIVITNGDAATNNATFVLSTGTLTNSGTLASEKGVGGTRTLQANITNTGTIAINTSTLSNGSSTTLLNDGTLSLASGIALTVNNGETVANETGGVIAATGTGTLSQAGGTFNQGAGKETGTLPVILDDATLNYTGKGTGTIALRGNSVLSGTINAGQVLAIQSTVSEHATTGTAAGFANGGTITLTNGDGAANNVTLTVAGGAGTLENKGTVKVEKAAGGVRAISGNLKNEKTLTLGAGATLKVSATFVQSKKGTFATSIAGASSVGALAVTGTASIEGALKITQVKPFLAKAGESFAILSSSARTGTFAKVSGAPIAKTVGLYYKPTYSATGVALVATLASVTVSPGSGLPGSTVVVAGSGFPPGDTVKLTFTDHKKVKTTLPSVVANGSGELSAEVTIPAGAAEGSSTINAKSALVGISITKPFTVT